VAIENSAPRREILARYVRDDPAAIAKERARRIAGRIGSFPLAATDTRKDSILPARGDS
jgi:hypothetical protein